MRGGNLYTPSLLNCKETTVLRHDLKRIAKFFSGTADSKERGSATPLIHHIAMLDKIASTGILNLDIRKPCLLISFSVAEEVVASRVILLKMTISLLETHFPIPMNVARTLRLYHHERCSQCPIEYRRADNSVQISMHLYTFFASPSTIGNTICTSKISCITFMVQCPWCFSQIMLMLFVPKPW